MIFLKVRVSYVCILHSWEVIALTSISLQVVRGACIIPLEITNRVARMGDQLARRITLFRDGRSFESYDIIDGFTAAIKILWHELSFVKSEVDTIYAPLVLVHIVYLLPEPVNAYT